MCASRLALPRHSSRARAAAPRSPRAAITLAVACCITGTLLLVAPRSAGAVVVHGRGYEATVLGWTSWYGSYEIAGTGPVWCIDHGLRAPDAAFGYAPTALPDVSAPTQAAMAWTVSRYGSDADPLTAAAIMLVLHDLAGAAYPYGRLNVDSLGTDAVAGFGGREGELLSKARAIKDDALRHAGEHGPPHLTVSFHDGGSGTGFVTATLTDWAAQPLIGVPIVLTVDGFSAAVPSNAAGVVTRRYGPNPTGHRASASVVVIDPALHAYAPRGIAAQRVVRPASVEVRAGAFLPPPATTTTTIPAPTTTAAPTTTTAPTTTLPTTTSTTSLPTTTTAPATTSTTTLPTTTTAPTTTSTTTLPTTPTTTTLPTTPTTTTLPTTPTTTPPPPPPLVPPELPRTGSRSRAGTAVGLGLLLLGAALLRTQRRPTPRL